MTKNEYVIACDIGTTGVKTCLFSLEETLVLKAESLKSYDLIIGKNGEAEQNPDQWWGAMCESTREILAHTGITPSEVKGISFCSQMQGIVLVDKNGAHLRPAMSYMDQRAAVQKHNCIEHGIQIAGVNIFKLLPWLYIAGAVGASVKDPIWKYHWVRDNEPDIFSRVHKWLDVKEYLIARATGNFIMTRDSAFATFMYDSRPGKFKWSRKLCRMLNVDVNHLPEVIESADCAGELRDTQALELGLTPGIKIFGGGGDASLIGVGAGAVENGDTHIYIGTSGWVSTVTDKRKVDINYMIASVIGAQRGLYNYFAEQETSGKCLEWVKNHLALDEIGIYLEKKNVTDDPESIYRTLYDYLSHTMSETPAGSTGVIFTPWLHGNRCPFEDPLARGMFFNLSLSTGKRSMIRSVVEGICFHKRWMLEAQDTKVKTSNKIRFAGGGALSKVTCQILADITGRTIETVENPQNAGAMGAALVCAVGLGRISSFSEAKKYIKVTATYTPDEKNRAVYDKNFKVFKKLYTSNRKLFKILNREP
ncbi:MAG: carbohydrate kinase [Spirochaetae bacterium HGW-Spirochaetae-5]|nr:MAG: carbohydrate kinase [Spirochaetae bacterium HGW-Spirochaetae-5]